MKVLIIEDNEAFGTVLKEELSDQGFSVKLVKEGGKPAFDAVDSFGPDMIILDMVLPKMSGLDILKELKSNPKQQSIPVIVLSSIETDENIKSALTLGAVDYFIKSQHPFKEIVEKIKQHMLAK